MEMCIHCCFPEQPFEFHFPIILETMDQDYKADRQPPRGEKINHVSVFPFEFRLFCPFVLVHREVTKVNK